MWKGWLDLPCSCVRADGLELLSLHSGRVSVECLEGSDQAGVSLDRGSVMKLHAWLSEWLERHS